MSENPQNHPRASRPPRAPKPARAPAPQRPAAPTPANPPGADGSSAGVMPNMPIVEDDDAVIVPALSPELLASHTPYAGAPRPLTRSLFFRRTVIPILLTMGVMLPALAAMWFASDANAIVRTTGLWLPVTFIVIGAVFLLLAIVNMAQVRHMMKGQR